MERITSRDVHGLARRILPSLRRLGLATDGARIAITRGSSTYGNAWSVELYENGERAMCDVFDRTHYGYTARDCHSRLGAQCIALEAIAYAAEVAQ